MKRHAMTYERGGVRKGKRKAVKTSKKGSVVSRQLRAMQRQMWNVLGGVGMLTVVIVLFRLIVGGGF